MGEAASDAPGQVLAGRYQLVEPVGSGGMAVVWRGVSLGAAGFRKPVAIKRILDRFRGFPEVVEMFVEEARVGALLSHPNIVQVLDFGFDKEEPFIVSELVEGLHLGQFLKSLAAPMEWPLVAAIGTSILRALEAAHERRDETGKVVPVLHRDVSPSNILLDCNGTVKLVDFGLARAMDRGRTTRPDIVKGKLSYLAPELVLGHEPSARSDLFSLGVVMWEALTGERLFDAETDLGVIERLRDARIPLLDSRRKGLPLGLVLAVHHALERDPRRRHRTARVMREALTKELMGLPCPPDPSHLATEFAAALSRLRAASSAA